MKLALSALVLAAAAGAANAAIFFESGVNDTVANANFVGTYGAPGEGILIDGAITPGTAGTPNAPGTAGDVDWFSFTLTTQMRFVASIFAITGNLVNPDSQLILVNSAGGIVTFDEDEGAGFMSAIGAITLNAGTYYIGVTGFDDINSGGPVVMPDGFDGTTQISGHNENWTYKLLIGLNAVPTPGTAALLGLGGLAAARRRR